MYYLCPLPCPCTLLCSSPGPPGTLHLLQPLHTPSAASAVAMAPNGSDSISGMVGFLRDFFQTEVEKKEYFLALVVIRFLSSAYDLILAHTIKKITIS